MDLRDWLKSGPRDPEYDGFLASAARVLAATSLGTGELTRAVSQKLLDTAEEHRLLKYAHVSLSIELVHDDGDSWTFGASSDPNAPIGKRFDTSAGLTGWLLRSHRRLLREMTSGDLPRDATPLEAYTNVEAAFLYLVRLDHEPAAVICAVSSYRNGIPSMLGDTLFRLGRIIEAVVSKSLEARVYRDRDHDTSKRLPIDTAGGLGWISRRLSLQFKYSAFWRWDGESEQLHATHLSEDLHNASGDLPPLQLGQGFTGSAAKRLRQIVDNHVENGHGLKTGIDTKLTNITSTQKVRSIMTTPVKDEWKFYGVITALGPTKDFFHEDDLGTAQQLADEIARSYRARDEQTLSNLQQSITSLLLEHLREPRPPSEFWTVVEAVLQQLCEKKIVREAAFFVMKRHTPNVYTVKAAAGEASDLRGMHVDITRDELIRGLFRKASGDSQPSRIERNTPLTTVWSARQSGRTYVFHHAVHGTEQKFPTFAILIGTRPATPHTAPLGKRPIDGVLAQITSAIFAFARLVLASADLDAASRNSTRLIAAETHDVKNSLSKIKHIAEAIQRGEEPGDSVARIINAADSLVIRLENIMYDNWFIRAGSSVAKQERRVDEPAVIDYRDLVARLIESVRQQSPEHTINYEDTVRSGTFEVFAQERWLSLAIRNIIDNAIKFGRSAPIDVRLRFIAEKDRASAGMLLLEIEDHGIGIPEAEKKAIFEKGHQNEYSRRLDVTGSQIALSVTKEIVESHKGSVWADSDGPNKGSTFFLEVPRYLRVSDENSMGGRPTVRHA